MSGFSTLLRAYRQRGGLSINGLARRVPCDPSYVSMLESGRRAPPRGAILRQVCAALALDQAEQQRLALAAVGMPEAEEWAQAAMHEASLRAANAILAACPCQACAARRQEATA